MSGDVLNPDLVEFTSARTVDLLPKPFDVETVNRLVAEVVARPAAGGPAAADQARGSRG